MCAIDSITECDDLKFVDLMKLAIFEFRNAGIPDRMIFLTLIATLGFKYWHENSSVQVNTIVEEKDSEYVRLHWSVFRASTIGVALYGDELKSNVDCACIAKLAGKFSGYITHRHFDSDNVRAISQLEEFVDSLQEEDAKRMFASLKRIYGRQIERLSIRISPLSE